MTLITPPTAPRDFDRAQRPGLDQNAQVATGFSHTEGDGGPPRFSPVYYRADLMTGYFGTAGTMAALLRRSLEGGSYAVRVSLARSTMWVQDLGLVDTATQTDLPASGSYPARTVTFRTPYGKITQLAPAVTFSGLPLEPATRLTSCGADPHVCRCCTCPRPRSATPASSTPARTPWRWSPAPR
ncbi:CoA transferase [Dactylosporangium sp. McL0621]|uniref:CoA transferase n=1 Tax=Dactylosporangium sp. McL0621 TaxID=3415678 RepID=UPI003CF6F604